MDTAAGYLVCHEVLDKRIKDTVPKIKLASDNLITWGSKILAARLNLLESNYSSKKEKGCSVILIQNEADHQDKEISR